MVILPYYMTTNENGNEVIRILLQGRLYAVVCNLTLLHVKF